MRLMIKKRLVAAALSTAILFCQISSPVMAGTKETLMTTELSTITAFEKLDEEVANRMIPIGAAEEEISKAFMFPETLTATEETITYERVEQTIARNERILSKDETDMREIPGDKKGRVASDSNAKEEPFEEEEIVDEDVIIDNDETLLREVVKISTKEIPVIWECDKEFSAAEPDKYIYTAKFADDIYQLKQGVKMPAITLEVSDMPSVYAVGDLLTIYVWVIDENGKSLIGGRIPGSSGYQPGFFIPGVGPTHDIPNLNGVARISVPISKDNHYRYFAFGDNNRVYETGQPPNLVLTEQGCLLKVELALSGQGTNNFTLIKPGDTDYPADPLNPENIVNATKTFHGTVGDGSVGIEGVTITAQHPVLGSIKTAVTDVAGNFSIELDELRFGTIYLTAKKEGNPLLTSNGNERYGISFFGADTAKNYDFGIPPAIREYVITVTGGRADLIKAAKDATVTISAGTPPPGKQFKRWVSSDGVSFTDAAAMSTTFKMPPQTVTVRAEFEAISSGGSDIKTYHGTTETDTFTYSDMITVKVVPNSGRSLPADPMALYNNNGDQISGPVYAADSSYSMTINTVDKALSIGSNSIIARYVNREEAEGTVTIMLNKKALTSAMVNDSLPSSSKLYDGSNRFSGVQLMNLEGLIAGDTAEATADGTSGSADVGRCPFTAITVSALSGSSAGYYTLSPAVVSGTVEIKKADAPKIPDPEVVKKATLTGAQSFDLNKLFKSYGRVDSYEIGTVTGSTDIVTVGGITGGELGYTLNGGNTGDTVIIPVMATMQNYQNVTVNIIVTLTDKYIPELAIPDITVPYGQMLGEINITGIATAGGITVDGTFSHNGERSLVPSAGSHLIKVIFTPDDTGTYTAVTAFINLIIIKATPAGKPGYTRITSRGKTLADAALNRGTITVSGTVAWEIPDTTVAVANTEYKWVFTPADGTNYNSITGNIILYTGSGSSSGGGGGSSSGGGGGGSGSPGMKTNTQPKIPEALGNWQQDQNGWKFVQPSGTAYLNTWIYVNGNWYRVGSDGYMLQGWNILEGRWYYLEFVSGKMRTGWLFGNGSWYYLEESGAMKTGWVEVAGSWYYLEESGAMKTGWVEVAGKWYFLYEDGKMAVDVTTPDGFYVDTSGIWQ